ncbi:hypothetical protein ATANTOWER_021337, partial [Ataeniobius toweri]|nr:hypothetical protein [Ataeniobius toweri]
MPSPTREDTAAGSRRTDDGGAESRGRETRGDGRDLVCALEMELTNRSLSNKMDCVSCDDLLNRNCANSAEVSVPLSPMGKRATHMEGDDLCRLIDRKFLIEDKKRLCALALGTALVGILLMIIHAEICPYVYEPGSKVSLVINCSISLSTGCLLILIIAFHYKDIRVLMNKHPARTLLVFILLFWLTASWTLTLCERRTEALATGRMDTALWLIAITFLTVGYGDVAPKTSCGKGVCLFTGVMGVACTAMLVAIVTEKLALNKGEKHVHFFMMDSQISKR